MISPKTVKELLDADLVYLPDEVVEKYINASINAIVAELQKSRPLDKDKLFKIPEFWKCVLNRTAIALLEDYSTNARKNEWIMTLYDTYKMYMGLLKSKVGRNAVIE